MNEYRISYNPFTKDYISGFSPHSIQLYNRGRQLSFDEYIRGIILDNVLYLRLYYPFQDLENKTLPEVNKASLKLLKENIPPILALIKNKDNITIESIRYNVINDLLSGLKLTCI
jgi:hypothetical protein